MTAGPARGCITLQRVPIGMTESSGPADSYGFNKFRKSSGSHRLTLVKAAVQAAEIDPRPPRPVLALLPVADRAWVGFEVDRYDSQRDRVDVRYALTETLANDTHVIGEFPVTVRGKLGSALILLPKGLVDTLDLTVGDRVTTVPVATGCLLFVTESMATDPDTDLEAGLAAARDALPEDGFDLDDG